MSTPPNYVTCDANEAVADIAYQTNEVIAIYPITPASPMGEHADAWAAAGRRNLDGVVPRVVELQSEGGAAGTVHGALQGGALATTFTASQGLLLMIPNMFKIAGELTPTVFHVAARTIATHALSIFGDHSDVMAVRSTGWAMLSSESVQQAHDFALIAHVATLRSRVPFLHFFDGFRTSHEINKIQRLSEDELRSLLPWDDARAHRSRALDPDHPVLRGSAQNPDVFFQAREACNTYYRAVPGIVQTAMEQFAARTGRLHQLCTYHGAPDADRVVVLMGSGAGAVREAVAFLRANGQRVGVLVVHLFRPFPQEAFLAALPDTTRAIAVLDRTKEPGASGEPLFLDVTATLAMSPRPQDHSMPQLVRGRYGLSSKEFTPDMAVAIFEELASERPRPEFTVGIVDDVTHLSLPAREGAVREPADVTRAVFYGLGSDGTVGAAKNSAKIIGEHTPLHVQGYFVYDSKKSGTVTTSHLRFSPRPIDSTYLVHDASFVACHQFGFLERLDVLEHAGQHATFLLNCPYADTEAWDHLPTSVRQRILDRQLRLFVIDADAVARDAGMAGHINTVMQTCFFAISGVLPRDEAIARIKSAIEETYARRGDSIVQCNFAAVDATLAALREIPTTGRMAGNGPPYWLDNAWSDAPDFVQKVTAVIAAGQGDRLPVSAFPVDGTFPTATSRFEKRSIAREIPIWDASLCIDCGLCAFVCPHAAIRMKVFPANVHADGNGDGQPPESFRSKPWSGKEPAFAGWQLAIQVAPDDCTGCGVCVDVCPARSKETSRLKALDMRPKQDHLREERLNWNHFLALPEAPRQEISPDLVKATQLLQPLFEFSGACGGCGETPYLKLLTQLFGDRLLVANATGCSSIYGGNLPATPWSVNADGRGPAWANSLFEDNAEFGLGMRLALDQKRDLAKHLLSSLGDAVGKQLVDEILREAPSTEAWLAAQRKRMDTLRARLATDNSPAARQLLALADVLVPRSVWIVGGDGWAYDIGFGGLDHVLAGNHDVNVLVLDTGVYSNTGGQASKATPRAAAAKFASNGKSVRKKDLGMLAVSYGHIYVAQIAIGANPQQTIRAFREAESFPGPSLLIAYSQCIAHGIDMSTGMSHQKDAIRSGFWPLYRHDPRQAHTGLHPLQLDSHKPTVPLRDFAAKEARFAMLARSDASHAQRLLQQAQQDIDDQWHFYEQMGLVERELDAHPEETTP
jgi:pyruvate-ferredoxin/flavodoxin oxidoreductase